MTTSLVMPTQTPGPRRFAPPASSSAARSTAFSGGSARFARPSQPTSSPFTRTPFSSNVRKDEIETDDDEDDLEEETAIRQQSTPAGLSYHPNTNIDASKFRDTAPQTSNNAEHKQSIPNSEAESSTLKGSKRRKTSHFRPEALNDTTDLPNSSPPNSSPIGDLEVGDQEHEDATERSRQSSPITSHANHATLSDESERSGTARESSPFHTDEDSPGKEFATPKMRTSRFRNHLTQSSQVSTGRQLASATTEQPLPSFQSRLLAASTSSTPGPHLRGPHPSLDFVLPDAFSPSRRRGQHEYVEHGHAGLVRSWILDIAARSGVTDIPQTIKQHSSSNIEANTFSIDEVVHRDGDDRFAVVSTADHDYTWMLIDTDAKPQPQLATGIIPKSRLERLHKGSRFVLRGGQVSNWMLDATTDSRSNEISGHDEADSTIYRVVVLWDLIH